MLYFSSSCVPYVASFSGLSIFDCSFGIYSLSSLQPEIEMLFCEYIYISTNSRRKKKYKQLCGFTSHELRAASPHQDTVGVGSFLASENSKKNLKISKRQSESVYRRRTDNTMAKRKSTKGQITIYKTYI